MHFHEAHSHDYYLMQASIRGRWPWHVSDLVTMIAVLCRQPVMMFVEGVLRYLFPNTKLFHYERTIKVPVVGKLMLSPLRLIGRSLAVAITTVLVSSVCLAGLPANSFAIQIRCLLQVTLHSLMDLNRNVCALVMLTCCACRPVCCPSSMRSLD